MAEPTHEDLEYFARETGIVDVDKVTMTREDLCSALVAALCDPSAKARIESAKAIAILHFIIQIHSPEYTEGIDHTPRIPPVFITIKGGRFGEQFVDSNGDMTTKENAIRFSSMLSARAWVVNTFDIETARTVTYVLDH